MTVGNASHHRSSISGRSAGGMPGFKAFKPSPPKRVGGLSLVFSATVRRPAGQHASGGVTHRYWARLVPWVVLGRIGASIKR